MKQDIDQMTHEDRITAIRHYSQDILSLINTLDPQTVTQIMLEMQQLHQYVESHLDFDDWNIEQPRQRFAA